MKIYILQGQIDDPRDEIWEVLYAGIDVKSWREYLRGNIINLTLEIWGNGQKIYSEFIEGGGKPLIGAMRCPERVEGRTCGN